MVSFPRSSEPWLDHDGLGQQSGSGVRIFAAQYFGWRTAFAKIKVSAGIDTVLLSNLRAIAGKDLWGDWDRDRLSDVSYGQALGIAAFTLLFGSFSYAILTVPHEDIANKKNGQVVTLPA